MMIQNIYGLADTFGLRNDVDFIPNRNQLNILILAPYFQFNHFVRFFFISFFSGFDFVHLEFELRRKCMSSVRMFARERESVNTRKRTHINLAIVFFLLLLLLLCLFVVVYVCA